jgi:hypothetical protein
MATQEFFMVLGILWLLLFVIRNTQVRQRRYS